MSLPHRFHTIRTRSLAWLLCVVVAAGLLICPCLPDFGQAFLLQATKPTPHSDVDDDPRVILEIGAATSWNFSGGAATFAPNLAAETTPIENILELEAGSSPFYSKSSTEWDTDLLFKKPWTLSSKTEFMLGIGPEWVHLQQGAKISNTLAGEVAGDFMFWPSGRHRFGWYLEPAYDYSFAAGHQQSIGLSGGLLIGIARRHK